MSRYQVIVGNIGTVYDGDNGFEADKRYNTYVGRSRRGEGRCAYEPVTLMKDGEPHKEHFHKLTLTREDKRHCIETWKALQARDCEGCTDCDDPENSDCFDSEVVMLSIGYAEVYQDGEVNAFGITIYNCAEDGM